MTRTLRILCVASFCLACSDLGDSPLVPAPDDGATQVLTVANAGGATMAASYELTVLDFEDLPIPDPEPSVISA